MLQIHRGFLRLCSKWSVEKTATVLLWHVLLCCGNPSMDQMSVLKKPFPSCRGKQVFWEAGVVCDLISVTFVSHLLVTFLVSNLWSSILYLLFSLQKPFLGFSCIIFSFIFINNVGKKNLDLSLVPHFRCKDRYSIDSKLFLLRGISFCFCAIICMNLVTRRLYCDMINLYCYLKW